MTMISFFYVDLTRLFGLVKPLGSASRKCGKDQINVVPKYSQSLWNVLCVAFRKLGYHGKTSNVVNDVIVLNAYKLLPILLTCFTLLKKNST